MIKDMAGKRRIVWVGSCWFIPYRFRDDDDNRRDVMLFHIHTIDHDDNRNSSICMSVGSLQKN